MSKLEDKKLSVRGDNKRAFALLLSIFLVVIVSILSIRIIENNLFVSNLNTLKYLHLQGTIYMETIKSYIVDHSKAQILAYELQDERFNLRIVSKDTNTSEEYYIIIETVDDTPITLSEKIIK